MLLFIIGVVLGFVGGLLVGRKNQAKVEQAVSAVKSKTDKS